MAFSDMILSLTIIMIFIFVFSFSYIAGRMGDVRNNWKKYRCDPGVIPLAGYLGPEGTDTVSNFTNCLANTQQGFMGHFLAPLHKVSGLTNIIGGGILESVQDIRKMSSFMNFSSFNIFGSLLKMFVGFMTRIQIILMRIKNLIMKIFALGVVIHHSMESGRAGIISYSAGVVKPMTDFLGQG
jgi:hypothetical protein